MKKLKNSELNRIDVKSFKSIKKTPLIVVLDNIRSLKILDQFLEHVMHFLSQKYTCVGLQLNHQIEKLIKQP